MVAQSFHCGSNRALACPRPRRSPAAGRPRARSRAARAACRPRARWAEAGRSAFPSAGASAGAAPPSATSMRTCVTGLNPSESAGLLVAQRRPMRAQRPSTDACKDAIIRKQFSSAASGGSTHQSKMWRARMKTPAAGTKASLAKTKMDSDIRRWQIIYPTITRSNHT
jgi:hypothetical protein